MKKIRDWSIKLWWWFGRFLYHSKVLKGIGLGLALFFVVYSIAQIAQHIQWLKNAPTRQEREKAQQKADNLEKVLTKWVYTHSDRISEKTSRLIVQSAMRTDKPLLILSVVAVESEFVPTAVSNKGAKGLTQVMWKTWSESLKKANIAKEERELFDIDVSIRAGNFVLDDCFKQGGDDISKVLQCYLGKGEGWYKNRITENLANLYLITRER